MKFDVFIEQEEDEEEERGGGGQRVQCAQQWGIKKKTLLVWIKFEKKMGIFRKKINFIKFELKLEKNSFFQFFIDNY